MFQTIEKLINSNDEQYEIKLKGRIKLKINDVSTLNIGHNHLKSLIQIKKSNIVIDGSDAIIDIEVENSLSSDYCIFYLSKEVENVEMRNLKIIVNINNPTNTTRKIILIYNESFGLKINNCNFKMISKKQINLFGVYNCAKIATQLETKSDNLVINNSHISVSCIADYYDKDCITYGVYNYLSNSIIITNSYIYSINSGKGDNQKSIGVYTSGRYGRFIGNNIKANGSYSEGLIKEKATAIGFLNEGICSLINSNNIVGEWGGKAIGIINKGENSIINSNKVLSTHTIIGRSIINQGNRTIINNNMIISTSRNARLIELQASNCTISNNLLEVLLPQNECQSGCGIYAAFDNNVENLISQNTILNVATCGIFINKNIGAILNNQIYSLSNILKQGDKDNIKISQILDESNIHSILKGGM